MDETHDVVIIGAGPGGEAVVRRLAGHGIDVVIVERELVGGECPYWACMPSKTLLRPPEVRLAARRVQGLDEPGQHWREIARYRDFMISDLDDTEKAERLEHDGATLIRGAGRLAGDGRVTVGDRILRAQRIVIATGSETDVPPVEGLADAGYWTNRELYTMQDLPGHVLLVGGGPVGVESAQMLRRYGCDVTIVEASDRLLANEDPPIGAAIGQRLAEEGVDVRTGVSAKRVHADAGRIVVELDDGTSVATERIVVAAGRKPRTSDLGLEAAGVTVGDDGKLEVDDECRIGEEIWAVGDVTSIAPFTHVAHYQGRVVADGLLGRRPTADYRAVPRAVFGDPEIAAVGLTHEAAAKEGVDVVAGRVDLETVARTQTLGSGYHGEMRVLADRATGTLVGAWAIGPLASEWIGPAVVAIKARVPIAVLRDMPMQFPTFGEALSYAVDDVDL